MSVRGIVRGITVICPACRTPWTALVLAAVSPCMNCGHVDTQILAIVRDVDTYGVPRENPPRHARRVKRRVRRRARSRARWRRRNPVIDIHDRPDVRRVKFPALVGHMVSRQVLELAYFNIGSVGRTPYVHEFESKGVELWALADGSLLLRHPQHRLWEDFVVPDGE